MRSDQSGPIIQVKERKIHDWNNQSISFYSFECCGGTEINKAGIEYPSKRCQEHNRQHCKHKRIRDTRKKFKKTFNRNRHRFIKMLTFGLPGDKTTSNRIKEIKAVEPFIRRQNSKLQYIQEGEVVREFQQDHKMWREELRSRFNKLRRDPWWKSVVDGGIWFYETTLEEIDVFEPGDDMNEIDMKIHPHFHCMILGPRNLAGRGRDFEELNNLFEKHGLGKPSVSLARSKNGRTINASLNKSLWYLTNYLKKQEHAEGINRGSFGIFNKKK